MNWFIVFKNHLMKYVTLSLFSKHYKFLCFFAIEKLHSDE